MIFLLVAALAVLVAVGLAVAFQRLNDYLQAHHDELAARASAALGRPVSFGTAGASLRGGLSARVTDLRIGEDPDFGGGEILSARAVFVSINPLAAILGRFRIGQVAVEALSITLVRTAAGWNVDSLVSVQTKAAPPSPATGTAVPEPGGAPPGVRAGSALAAVVIANVNVSDGRVEVVDRRVTPPSQIALEGLDIGIRNLGLSAPIHFELSGTVLGGAAPNLAASGTVDPRPPVPLDMRVELKPFDLDAIRTLPGVRERLPASLGSDGTAAAVLRLQGDPSTLAVLFDADLTATGIRAGSGFAKPSGMPLKLDAAANLSPGDASVDVHRFALTLGTATLSGKGRLHGDPLAVDLTLDLPPAPLADLAAPWPALAARQPAGTVAASVEAAGTFAGGQVPALRGHIQLTEVGAAVPSIGGLTAAIQLDGDRAVLPETTFRLGDRPVRAACTAAPLRAPTLTCTAAGEQIALAALGASKSADDVLRGVHATASLDAAGKLLADLRSTGGMVRRVAYGDLHAVVQGNPMAASIESISVRAFEGALRGSGHLRFATASAPPEFDLNADADGVELAALLAWLGEPGGGRIGGRLRAELKVTGAGSDWPAARHTLHGAGRAEVRDGKLRNVNLAEEVLGGLTGISGLTGLLSPRVRARHPGLFSGAETSFEQLAASIRIGDGRVATDDARLRAREFDVDARGTVSLAGRLDLHGLLTASPDLSGSLIGSVREAAVLAGASGRLTVPFAVTGTVAKPRIYPDGGAVAELLAGNLIGGGIDALLGRSKQQPGAPQQEDKTAGDILQRGLKSLLGR